MHKSNTLGPICPVCGQPWSAHYKGNCASNLTDFSTRAIPGANMQCDRIDGNTPAQLTAGASTALGRVLSYGDVAS